MPLKLLSSGGGSVLLTANTTAADFTVNVPAVNGNMVTTGDTASVTQAMLGSGLAGTGPSFSAWHYTQQTSITAFSSVKVNYDYEEWDTANCFSSSRFTPNVAGYYQANFAIQIPYTSSTANILGWIYKNGTNFKNSCSVIGSSNMYPTTTGSALVYLNGTTDYIEVYMYGSNNGSAYSTQTGSDRTFFQAFLVRAA